MLRRTLLLVVLSSLLAGLLAACGSSGGPPPGVAPGDTVVNDDVHVLDQGARDLLDAFTLDLASGDGELRFRADDPALDELQPGRVVVSRPIGAVAPHGFLQRVAARRTEGGEVVLETHQATLTDAFDQASIAYRQELKPADVTAVRSAYPGVSFRYGAADAVAPQAGASYDFTLAFDEVLIDADDDASTTDDQLVVNGSLSFNASASADIDIGWLADLDLFEFEVNLQESANVDVTGQLAASFQKQVEVARYTFGSFTVTVGPVPVVFNVDLVVSVGAQGQISARIETSATQSTRITVGARYSGGSWHDLSGVDSSFDYVAPTLTAGASARAWARPSLNVMIYGLAGPYVYAEAFVSADAELYRVPFWELRGGIGFGIGFTVDLPVVGKVADWSTELVGLEKTLQQSVDAPPSLTLASPADGDHSLDGAFVPFRVQGQDRESHDVGLTLTRAGTERDTATSTDGATVTLRSGRLCVGSYDFDLGAVDGAGHAVGKTVTIVVDNRVPEVGIRDDLLADVPVFPGAWMLAYADVSDITCPSGAAVNPALIQWYVDGSPANTGEELLYQVPAGATVGHTLQIEARYDDGLDVGSDTAPATVESAPSGRSYAPRALIRTPSDGDVLEDVYCGMTHAFEGVGIDPEDGELTGASLVWEVRKGTGFVQLGTGTDVSVDFCALYGGTFGNEFGYHDIRLTATDSGGAAGSATITVYVQPPG